MRVSRKVDGDHRAFAFYYSPNRRMSQLAFRKSTLSEVCPSCALISGLSGPPGVQAGRGPSTRVGKTLPRSMLGWFPAFPGAEHRRGRQQQPGRDLY